MKLSLGVVLLVSLITTPSSAAVCNYYRSTNRVTCGGVACDTLSLVSGGGKLPVGYYYIGDFRIHNGVDWFNLYKQKSDRTGFWDYNTKIPEEGCRGGFGLHYGGRSLGCITVPDSACFNRIERVLRAYPVIPFTVHECLSCYFGSCWRGTSTLTAPCTADLQVW